MKANNENNLKFTKLMRNWADFVHEVEKTYTATIDDYVFDLSHRDSLEDLIQSLPKNVADSFREQVQEYDERFMVATEELSNLFSVVKHLNIPKQKFWYFRKPKKISTYLNRYFV